MFYHPWFLLLLLLVPIMGWRLHAKGRRHSVPFSSAASGWIVRPTLRQRFAWLPSALTLLAITVMILALARPRFGREQTIINSEGIAIELVVDRSSSMQALDFFIDGSRVDRLRAIKNVAEKFVLGDKESDEPGSLEGRISDLIGLIVFAGYADAITPPTLDHQFLASHLRRTRIVTTESEDGTAIGDAISLAVEKLNSLDERMQQKIKSKVIILLTDGENTAGEIEPLQAAELAKTMDVKIYAIGVGTRGRAPFPVRRSRTGQLFVQNIMVQIDEKTLRAIAEATGGMYFRATDSASLESIYEQIDLLEKTKVDAQQFVDYRELAVQPTRLRGYNVPPLLLIALVLLASRIVLASTVWRQIR